MAHLLTELIVTFIGMSVGSLLADVFFRSA